MIVTTVKIITDILIAGLTPSLEFSGTDSFILTFFLPEFEITDDRFDQRLIGVYVYNIDADGIEKPFSFILFCKNVGLQFVDHVFVMRIDDESFSRFGIFDFDSFMTG